MSYDPSIGTWMEEDPDHYIDGANMYDFEENNSVGRLDPTGTMALPIGPGAGGEYCMNGEQILEDGSQVLNYLLQAGEEGAEPLIGVTNDGYIISAEGWWDGMMSDQGLFTEGDEALNTLLEGTGQAVESGVIVPATEGGLGASGAGGYFSANAALSPAAGVVTAGAAAGIVTYLAMEDATLYYQNNADSQNFQNMQANQASQYAYWRNSMKNWADNFIQQYANSPCSSATNSAAQANALKNFESQLGRMAGAISSQYTGNSGPQNANQMIGLIVKKYGTSVFSQYDKDLVSARTQ